MEALQVGGRESPGVSFDGGDPDDATAGGGVGWADGEKRGEEVAEEVVAEDVGAEDLSEPGLFCTIVDGRVGFELRLCYVADTGDFVCGIGDGVREAG